MHLDQLVGLAIALFAGLVIFRATYRVLAKHELGGWVIKAPDNE